MAPNMCLIFDRYRSHETKYEYDRKVRVVVKCSNNCSTFHVPQTGIGSVSMLTLLSLHRCLLITLPHQSPRINSKVACVSILVFSWVQTGFVVLPTLFGWGYFRQECLGIR